MRKKQIKKSFIETFFDVVANITKAGYYILMFFKGFDLDQ